MTPTIAELWNGNLKPVCYSGKNNKELKESVRLVNKTLEKLREALNVSEKDLLEKYSDNVEELMILLAEQAFCDGYCIGTKITVEALTGVEQVF